MVIPGQEAIWLVDSELYDYFNHVHLLVVDEGERRVVPRARQLVADRTGQEYHQRKHRQGARWEDRYHATAVESGDHLARCLVTLDLDFANPMNFPPRDYHWIAVLRLPPRPSYNDLLILCRTSLVALKRQGPGFRPGLPGRGSPAHPHGRDSRQVNKALLRGHPPGQIAVGDPVFGGNGFHLPFQDLLGQSMTVRFRKKDFIKKYFSFLTLFDKTKHYIQERPEPRYGQRKIL